MADDFKRANPGPDPSPLAGVPPATPETDDDAPEIPEDERGSERTERSDRSITDFVRRAVSAGVVAASRSKDDIMRAAGGEVRSWLEHLNLHEEITKVLSKMVVEVKTEIRFRPREDGRIVPETTNDVKVKGGPR